MNSNTIRKWGNVVHKHRQAERRYWWMSSTDTFPCSLCFYSVVFNFIAHIGKTGKRQLVWKLQEKPNCWIYEFMLVSLCLSSEEDSKITTIKGFSDICTFSLACCGFFSMSVCVDFVGWEMFCYILVGLVCPSKDVSFDQQIVPGAW